MYTAHNCISQIEFLFVEQTQDGGSRTGSNNWTLVGRPSLQFDVLLVDHHHHHHHYYYDHDHAVIMIIIILTTGHWWGVLSLQYCVFGWIHHHHCHSHDCHHKHQCYHGHQAVLSGGQDLKSLSRLSIKLDYDFVENKLIMNSWVLLALKICQSKRGNFKGPNVKNNFGP